jgi:hypothetical protein
MGIVSINVEKLLTGIREQFQTAEFEQAIAELKEGFKISKVLAVAFQAVMVCERVAESAGELYSSEEKQEAVATFVDEVVQLPFFLEPFDGPFIKLAINTIVGWLNIIAGKKWLAKLSKVL